MLNAPKFNPDDAWDALCLSAEIAKVSPTLPIRPAAHPFERNMGIGPYRLSGTASGESHCAHCGTRIKNIYRVANAAGGIFDVGSECILQLGNGFSAHLVGQVKTAKRQLDREKRIARARANRDSGITESAGVYPEETAFLKAYNGNFEFYLSLRNQFLSRGGLSDNQWACVTRAVAKQKEYKEQNTKREFTLAVGTTLIVGKFIAHVIGRENGLNRPHFAIEVTEVQAESAKAYKVRGKLAAHRTSRCCVCGLAWN